MAGLFFCLASAEGAGLLFCPATIKPHTSVYSTFCACPCNLTANTARQRTRPCNGFSCDCTHLTANDTRPAKADMPPPAPRWSISQRRSTSSEYQIPAPRRTLCSSTQTAYYNNVYKRVQHTADHASPAGSRCFPRLALAWHRVSLALAWYCAFFLAQRRGTIDGYRRCFFRAFAR